MVATWVIVLFVAGAILVALGVYAWGRRGKPGVLSFSLLLFAIAGWCLSYALELLAQDLPGKMFWIRVEYPTIVATSALWWVFCLQYTGHQKWFALRHALLLAIIPTATVLSVWTNDLHHLHYAVNTIKYSGAWPLLHVEYGPTFWLNAAFAYLCLLGGTALLVQSFVRASPLYRQQATMLLVGALVPWAGNALYLLRLHPWPDLDLTPLAFFLSGLAVTIGLFRYRLLQVLPVARQAVIEGMPTAMLVLDDEGYLAELNPAARALFQLGDREVIGELARDVLWPRDVVEQFTGVASVDTELRLGDEDDQAVYRLTISPLDEKEEGVPTRLILISDITDQISAREEARRKARELAKQNRHLSLLNEIAQIASSTLDRDTLAQTLADTLVQIIDADACYITWLDKGTGHVRGLAAAGPVRETYREMEPPSGELTLTESVLRLGRPVVVKDASASPHISSRIAAMFPGQSLLGLPLHVASHDLGVVVIAFHTQHTFTEDEIARASQGADVAALALENARLYAELRTWATELEGRVEARTQELQDTQAQLLRAERMAALGELSAGLAHEIGHPLNLISGYMDMLSQELGEHPYLPTIQDSIAQLARLLNQLRDYSRTPAEERNPVLVNELVESVLSLADQELQRNRITTQRNLDEVDLVEADGRQLEQVILNLLINARDAMPQGGNLTVSTRQREGWVVIELADTGVGIPPENMERIFEPHFSTKADKGTGLGLAISQRIIDAHGGRIEVNSTLGKGTIFAVYLPAHPEP